MLFAWILTQCFVLLCHLRRPLWHTPPLQPSQVPSAPKPPLPAPEVAREAASRVRPPPQRRVPLVSCKIWSENLYHISSIEAWWLVFPRPAFCGNGGNCFEVIILRSNLWSCGIMISMQYAETQWYAHGVWPAIKLLSKMSICIDLPTIFLCDTYMCWKSCVQS